MLAREPSSGLVPVLGPEQVSGVLVEPARHQQRSLYRFRHASVVREPNTQRKEKFNISKETLDPGPGMGQ